MKSALIVIALCFCLAAASSGFTGDHPIQEMKQDAKSKKLHAVFQAMVRADAKSLVQRAPAEAQASATRFFAQIDQLFRFDRKNRCVVVDAAAAGDPENLMSVMKAMGTRNMTSYGRMVSACVPLSAVEPLAASGTMRFMQPAAAITNVGLVTSQGDRAMRTDELRDFTGLDGRGVRVGVLSDSFGCLQGPLLPDNPFTTVLDDIINDDLPPDVRVLSDYIADDCIDEGRAILQLVHDVAPEASGAFHTAFNGQADFANGILELAYQAGADVIVDDTIYEMEPMFADGIIAQAADTVKGWGVPYFSSAGNQARASYESNFRPSGDYGLIGERHDFDPTRGVDPLQSVTVSPGGFAVISFQWDEPYFSVSGEPGASSDLDFLFYFNDGSPVPLCDPDTATAACQFPGITHNVGGDPIEVIAIANDLQKPVTLNVSIELFSGPAPNLMKYVFFERSRVFHLNEFDTESPTTFGHANAVGAEAVGAAIFSQTEEFPQPDPQGLVDVKCIPACVNFFSSAGGVPILFDQEGNRLTEAEVRLKPGITGPDGGNTTFLLTDSIRDEDEFPNFFGTSASAPHVAAAIALAISARGQGIASDGKFRLCEPQRSQNITVNRSEVLELLEKGARFRDCDALQPDGYLDALHETAQDMSLRAFPLDVFAPEEGGGTAVPVPEPSDAPLGFDFDTGFGFIDAVEFFNVVVDD